MITIDQIQKDIKQYGEYEALRRLVEDINKIGQHCENKVIEAEEYGRALTCIQTFAISRTDPEMIKTIDSAMKKAEYAIQKKVGYDKADEFEYTLGGKEGVKGLIVPSPIKEVESTPMRDIKSAICGRIGEIIEGEEN